MIGPAKHTAVAAVQVEPRRWVVADVIDGEPTVDSPIGEFTTAEPACGLARTDAALCGLPLVVVPLRGAPFTPAVHDLAAERRRRAGA